MFFLLYLFPILCSTFVQQDIFAPEVYNTYFYINTNPDLIAAGILTEKQARQHWQTHGITEGRQACGSFHTLQYLARYLDISIACGNSTSCALSHYLSRGKKEGRLGYQEGGGFGRWTISSQDNDGLFISASTRMAGAIDSLVWNSFEFVNQFDHGRELQVAFTNGSGECFNPTEAGSSDDATSAGTTSQLLGISARVDYLTSESLPAFWLAPGQKEPNPSPTCQTALNNVKLSNFKISKIVFILSPNHVLYNFSILISDPCPSMVQIEGPTQYLPIDFNSFFTFDPVNDVLTPIQNNNGEVQLPLVFSTQDHNYAVGCFGHNPGGWMVTYAKFFFPSEGSISADTSKWSIVYRFLKPVNAGTVFSFSSELCVGTLDDVVSCMKSLTLM